MSRIDHLSYSAIMTFLRNQVEFQKRYIAKVWDEAKTPSLVIGTAFHKAMEVANLGESINDAITAGLREVETTSDYEIDYGKTGSREKMIKEYTSLVNKYFEECEKYEVVDVEKRMESAVHGVPMVGVTDLVKRNKSKKLSVLDYKTVSFFSSPSDPQDPEYQENYKYLLQGYIYLVLAENEYSEEVEDVVFLEVKKSINRDGSPQTREFVYPRQSLLEFAPVARKIITNVFSYVNDDNSKFFPNPSDMINGQSSMEIVSNMEEGFDAARVKRIVNSADKFAPRNVTVDLSDDTGSNEEKILKKFIEFGIGGVMAETFEGASVIRYTFRPNRGIAMSSVAKRVDDLAIALKSKSVRVEAPIPGTDLVGVEIPNENRKTIDLKDEHMKPGTMEIPLGVDVFGKVLHKDLAEMPHLLIAGQTGSGKSVMLNVILESLTKQLNEERLKLVLIDPKQVELTMYEGDKHLLMPIVTDNIAAAQTLDKMVKIMEERYSELREAGVRKIDDYVAKGGKMSKIVVVVDEFADLMMMSTGAKAETLTTNIQMFTESINNRVLHRMAEGKKPIAQKDLLSIMSSVIEQGVPDVQLSIVRLAQKARAVGIHLILATQRPSAEVVTGLIKANIPAKIAFTASNEINSRIILDESGAEKLTGKGDMLYRDPSEPGLRRLQGLYR